jgi:hypothetical protein
VNNNSLISLNITPIIIITLLSSFQLLCRRRRPQRLS